MIQFKWKECYGCSSPTRCEAEKTCYIIAPRATEAGEDGKIADSLDEWARHAPASEMCDVMHKAAIALRTRPLSSRPAIIKECARVCEERATAWDKDIPDGNEREFGWMHDEAAHCASAIRALAPREQNAAPHPYTRGDINNDACQICGVPELRHAAGPAVAAPYSIARAFEEWWFRPEGLNLKKHYWNCWEAALRAAPSLSREEWRLIGVAINGYFTGPTSTVELEALRAKVREAGK